MLWWAVVVVLVPAATTRAGALAPSGRVGGGFFFRKQHLSSVLFPAAHLQNTRVTHGWGHFRGGATSLHPLEEKQSTPWSSPPPTTTTALSAAAATVPNGAVPGDDDGQHPSGQQQQQLPEAPSLALIALLWLNTTLLGVLGLLVCWQVGPLSILGAKFEVSRRAILTGAAWAAPWIALSLLPLEKWFPRRTAFLKDVGDHTELFTAVAFGSRFGGLKRWLAVILGSTLISATAGICEELLFRGVAQNGLRAVLGFFVSKLGGFHSSELSSSDGDHGASSDLLLAAAVAATPSQSASSLLSLALDAGAVVGASAFFGYLHNYCRGYALLATFAGCFFGTVYVATENLAAAATAHALVDVVAFLACYAQVAKASPGRRAELAGKHFPITAALRETRRTFDERRRQKLDERRLRRDTRVLSDASLRTPLPWHHHRASSAQSSSSSGVPPPPHPSEVSSVSAPDDEEAPAAVVISLPSDDETAITQESHDDSTTGGDAPREQRRG